MHVKTSIISSKICSVKKSRFVAFLLFLVLFMCSCSSSYKLGDGIKVSGSHIEYDFLSGEIEIPESYDGFSYDMFESSLKLFTRMNESKNGSTFMVSPYSLYSILSMTANGAGEDTKKEIKALISSNISEKDLNNCMSYLGQRLQYFNNDSGRFCTSNMICLNSDGGLNVAKSFIQKNVDYYDAGIFGLDFSDDSAPFVINRHVSEKTYRMMDSFLHPFGPKDVMSVLSVASFDDIWAISYSDDSIYYGVFHGIENNSVVTFLSSQNEHYIKTENASGFIKGYANTPVKFLALLPDKDIDINDFIKTIDTEMWNDIINQQNKLQFCYAAIPEFSINMTLNLDDVLKEMGIKKAFTENADFSRITSDKQLLINDVKQEVFLKIEKNGTEGATSNDLLISDGGASKIQDAESTRVVLDRPFVFAVIDNESNIPIFLGTVKDIKNYYGSD